MHGGNLPPCNASACLDVTVEVAAPIATTSPDNLYAGACTYADQGAINTAYTNWLAQFSVSGGCSSSGSYGTAPAAPTWCIGDTVSVTYEITGLCLTTSITRYFGIAAPPAVTINKPADSYTSACAYANQDAINAAYSGWLAQFSVSGGCNPSGSYGTAPAAPIWCVGDTVSVTYEVTDLCFTTSITRYFGIAAPPAVTVNKPDDSYTSACAYANQDAINAAYSGWLAQFSVSGGCNPSGSYGTAPAAPLWCIGDTVSVTYEVTDLCFTTSVTRYFGISAPPAVNVSKPDDSYTLSCAYADQDAINTAYTNWLAQFSVSGGCNPSGSYGTAPAAPIWCVGDTVSVTYEVTDLCFTTSVTRYFGIAAPPLVIVNKPDDSYSLSCAYADQVAINSAYTDWLAQFSVSGGCNPSGSYGTAPAAPIWCIGDTVSSDL